MNSEFGSIGVAPATEIEVGSQVTLTFEYTVGAKGMRRGGSLRIATPNDAWGEPIAPMHRYFQRGHERGGYDDGYCSYARRNLAVSLQSEGRAWIDLSTQECCVTGNLTVGGTPWARHIIAVVMEDDLQPGDCIRIIYGDQTWGEKGVEAPRVAPTDKDRFHAFVDTEGTRDFVELPGTALLGVRVVAGSPAQFNVVLPAIVRPGASFRLRLAAMDRFRNRPSSVFSGVLRLGTSHADVSVVGRIDSSEHPANLAEIDDVRCLHEGIRRFWVEPADGTGVRSCSNPVLCSSTAMNLYFGDLHCQSMYHSDSLGTPADGYAYGRDVAGLDFMAITDSGGCHKADGWLETQEATESFYTPGRFVSLKGFEYGARLGHRNVIYRDCVIEPVLSGLPRDDLEALFSFYRGRDVLIIPHHTKVWTDWRFHDPELEPIAEAYSCWGSGVESDDPLWHKSIKPGSGLFNALARGYRFGFIGSGDSHAGTPGRSYPADRQWCVNAKSGFACVYALELTREAIFDALRQRRCYATTGARMILRFSLNDTIMGGTAGLDTCGQARVLRSHVIGTDRLSSLRLVKNGMTLVQRELHGDEEFFEYQDGTPAEHGDHYFICVTQRDGNAAWSSPVWVACADL